MSIRTILTSAIVALFLTTGVALLQSDRPQAKSHNVPYAETTRLAEVNCGIFIMPALPPIPKIRPMDDRIAKSRSLSEEHLLQIIKEQREHAHQVQQRLDQEYRYYIKNCSKSTQ